MRILKFITFGIVLIVQNSVLSQVNFYKRYSGNGYDYGYGIVQTIDTGYLITGASSSFTQAAADVFLLKTDSLGTFQWSGHYGGNESDVGVRVKTIEGNGHFIAGYSNSFGTGDYDFMLLKTDLTGNLVWQKNYGTPGWERLYDASLTADSGMMMVGETTSGTQNSSDIFIVRTNFQGDTVWTKKIGGIGQDAGKTIRALNDSVFIVGGKYYLQDSLKTKGFVLKIHKNGSVFWVKTVGDNGIYEVSDLDIDPVRINFVGFRMNSPSENEMPFYGRMDFEGVLDYAYHESPSNRRVFDYITSYGTEGKKYIAYRYVDDPSSSFGFDVSVARLQNGLWWDNSFVNVLNPSDDAAGQIIATSDGGVVVVGNSTVYGAGGANVFVLKVGPNASYPVIPPDQETEQLVELGELTSIPGFEIYPNPASNVLRIVSDNVLMDSVRIVDLYGKTVLVSSLNESDILQLSTLESGTYFIEISNSSENILARKKLMIAR
jgi:hypothetical protein